MKHLAGVSQIIEPSLIATCCEFILIPFDKIVSSSLTRGRRYSFRLGLDSPAHIAITMGGICGNSIKAYSLSLDLHKKRFMNNATNYHG